MGRVGPYSSSPQPSNRSAVIVCEREPYWTPELQRQFHQSSTTVRGCQQWSKLAELSQCFERVVQVVDLNDAVADCLTGLADRDVTLQNDPVILVASPRFQELEWVLRDAGVQAFFSEYVSGADLARCCRRWLNDAERL